MEAYCRFQGDEFYVFNMHIDAYGNAGYVTHEPRRIRKLLMKRTELTKLQRKLRDVGVTVVPTRLLHRQASGYAKLDISSRQGQKARRQAPHHQRQGPGPGPGQKGVGKDRGGAQATSAVHSVCAWTRYCSWNDDQSHKKCCRISSICIRNRGLGAPTASGSNPPGSRSGRIPSTIPRAMALSVLFDGLFSLTMASRVWAQRVRCQLWGQWAGPIAPPAQLRMALHDATWSAARRQRTAG